MSTSIEIPGKPAPWKARVLKLEMNHLPPASLSKNRSRGAHWSATYREVHGEGGIFDEVIVLLWEAGWSGPPMEKVQRKAVFGLPDRRKRDHENLILRMAPVWDALVGRVMVDDSLEMAGWPEYGHFYSPQKPMTILWVYEAGAGPANPAVGPEEA